MVRPIFFILIFLSGIHAIAQDVQFTATAPKVVEAGEQFRLVYNLNEQPSSVSLPEFDGIEVLGGPSVSSSSNIQFINGQMTKEQNFGYTYYVRATKEGNITIAPATAKIGKKTYNSNSLSIEVVKGNKQPAQTQQGSTSPNTPSGSEDQNLPSENLFIKTYVSKSNVYQGEQIVATIKIFSKYNLADLNNFEYPDFSGFYKQDIDNPQQISLQRENVNGQIYLTAVLYQTILIPQQTGKLTITQAKIDAFLRQQVRRSTGSVWDDFFGSSYQTVKKTIESNPVVINVNKLPANKPVSFSGAVGEFGFSASVDKTELESNDAVTLTLKISGNGNIKLVEKPEVNFPETFDIYDPEVSTNIKSTVNGVQGSKTYKIVMIPRHPGEYKIDPVEFTYFDVSSGSYKKIRSNEFILNVSKGQGVENGQVVAGLSKEDVKYIGKDIQFIKTGNPNLKPKNKFFVGSPAFYLSYLLGLSAFIIIVVLLKHRIKKYSDIRTLKISKARKIARKRLATAKKFIENDPGDRFYEELLKAIQGYLSDRLAIPVSEMNRDVAVTQLQNRNVEQSSVDKLTELIDSAEFARYAPSKSDFSRNEMLSNTIQLISDLEQQIKS